MTNTSSWRRLFSLTREGSLWRYAGDKATSQWVVIPVLVFLSFNAVPAGFLLDSLARNQRLINIALALLTAWLFFTVVGLVINSLTPRFTTLRVILISVMFALTETVRIFSFYGLSSIVTATTVKYDPLFTVIGSMTTGLLMFGLLSTAIIDSSTYHRDYKSLALQTNELQGSALFAVSSIERTKNQLLQSTRERILLALGRTITPQADGYEEIVDELFHVSEEVVRPLSHQLSNEPVDIPQQTREMIPPRVPLATIVNSATFASPFRPVEYALIVFLIASPAVFLFRSVEYLIYLSVAIAGIYFFNLLARRFLLPRMRELNTLVRVIVISLVYVLPVAVVGLLAETSLFTMFLSEEQLVPGLVYGALLMWVLGWLIAISQGLRYSRMQVLQELEAVTRRLEWANTRLQAQLWMNQKRLALTLHNEVQATLLAAALRLQKALQSGPDEVKQTLPEVQHIISECLLLTEGQDNPRSLQQSLQHITEMWEGLLTLEIQISPEDHQRIEADHLGIEILNEVVSEFHVNSLKHGKASSSYVSIELTEPDIAQVTLRNNGLPLENTAFENNSLGLGNVFIAAVTLNNCISNLEGGGVELVVEIPISASS